MQLHIFSTKQSMGAFAGRRVASLIMAAIAEHGDATIILATGASQFEMLEQLVAQEVDWSRVTAFHLDEYIGLPSSHPASFRKYLQERFVDRISGLGAFHFVNGDAADIAAECARVNALIQGRWVDVACVGIGENGHLAFNDPPADFAVETPFIVVQLDEACRRQQLGEGWFPTLEDVPTQAISMSIRQIMRCNAIVCTVPDARKAEAVKKTVEGPVTPDVPASILQEHPRCELFLDAAAAALLRSEQG
jgi:glucosamine-6-phosphate deaminase